MLLLCFLIFSSEQNPLDVIDKEKADYYRIFAEIDSFVLAEFYEDGDSVQVRILYTSNGDTLDSVVNIEKSIYNALKFYCANFQKIITDITFREHFVENFSVAWPIITEKEIKEQGREVKEKSCLNSFCCISGTIATGAYLGGLAGREVCKVQTGIPCGHPEYGYCVIPFEYYVYRINPKDFWTGTAIGTATGLVMSKKLYYRKTEKIAILNALSHDIVAFDFAGNPITYSDIQKESEKKYRAILGAPGIIGGLVGSSIISYGLVQPYLGLKAEKDWDEYAAVVPILIISQVSFFQIVKYAIKKGEELDQLATIEKIKKKRLERQ